MPDVLLVAICVKFPVVAVLSVNLPPVVASNQPPNACVDWFRINTKTKAKVNQYFRYRTGIGTGEEKIILYNRHA